MIRAPLFRDLVQNDTGTGPKVQAFDLSKHGHCDAQLTAVDGSLTDRALFVAEPHGKLRILREVRFMKVRIGPLAGIDEKAKFNGVLIKNL